MGATAKLMTRDLVMYDAAGEQIGSAPGGGDAYAGYLTDSTPAIANFPEVVRRHYGHAHCVSIGILETTLCVLLDVEPGNPVRTPQGVRNSFENRKAHHVWRPGFYADQSDMETIVLPGLSGIPRDEYRLVIAEPGTNAIPAGYDGAQIEFAGSFDKSLLRPDFFPAPTKSSRKPTPKVTAAAVAGVITTGLQALLHAHGLAHWNPTPVEASAITTTAAVLAGYLK